jgi:hypothetical protein
MYFKKKKSHIALLTQREIPETRIVELERENAEWGLENGDMFDGHIFRDVFGTPYRHHPSKLRRPSSDYRQIYI